MSGDWSFTYNGLEGGPGTAFNLTSLDGWFDVQGVTTVDTPKPQTYGTWTSPDYNPSRLVTIGIDVVAGGGLAFADAVAALEAATQVQTEPQALTIDMPGRDPETIYCKPRARTLPTDFQFQMGLSNASVQFWANDPRRFGAGVAGTTGLPISTGGTTWPVTWPVTWTGSTTEGRVTLQNGGNTFGPVVITVYGPVTGPSLYLEDTGMLVAFSDQLQLNASDWMTVDMEARTALFRGTSSVAAYLISRDWFGLQPGSNTIAFQSTTYDSRASMTVAGSPAWM